MKSSNFRSWLAAGVAVLLAVACSGGSTSTVPQPTATGSAGNTSVGNAQYVGGAFAPLRLPGTSAALLTMTVTSSAFTNGGPLPASAPGPAANGCSTSGTATSPQLTWTPGPAGTKAYMVTVFDTDAPTGLGFVHWTLLDLPASVTSLPAGYGTPGAATLGGINGYNDQGFNGYTGPCPPVGDGAHHYWITVSALNTTLAPILASVGFTNTATTTTATLAAITFFVRQNNAILAQGQIVGTYGH
jgi:Raf kinase inhibitor-like YbhB/YbcL family protein